MGNQKSKVDCVDYPVQHEEPAEGNLPSTPIQAPKSKISDIVDPRSPSANIVRTPILVDANLNQTPTIGEINVCNDDKSKIIAYDPRSPSIEFIRTPVLVEHIPVKLRNKTLDKVRKQYLEFTPVKSVNSGKTDDNSERKPKGPILLDSTPITKKTEKRNSLVGLLETNLDYIETDLNVNKIISPTKNNIEAGKLEEKDENDIDNVSSNSENIKNEVENVGKTMENFMEAENTDKIEEEKDLQENIERFTEIAERNKESEKVLIDENVESVYFIEKIIKSEKENSKHLNEVVNKINKVQISNTENKQIVQSPEIIENNTLNRTFDVESMEKICEIDNEIHEVITIAQVNDFEKKISDLIYEDKVTHRNSLPRTRKLNSRTPLGNVNICKSASKLRVSNKPKNEYMVSKIPIFKDKRNSIQCENTPPRSMNVKKAQWDTDKTLII